MKIGDKSTVLSCNVKRKHKDMFNEICEFYNSQEKYFYVPKYEIMQKLIDHEYERIFNKNHENSGN